MKFITKGTLAILFIAANFFSNAQCFEIESILVDACGTVEGENEMVRFKVGNADLCTDDLTVTWASANGWLGLIQNSTTAQVTTDLNATILGCGELIEPTSCVLPANSTVILVTSTDIDVTANSFANLNETIYVIYQTAGNTGGHFANNGSGLRTLTMEFSAPIGCEDDVTYDRADLINTNGTTGGNSALNNGATVNFEPAGTPTYINNGCQAPFEPFEIDLTGVESVSGTQNFCPGDVIEVSADITGDYEEIVWSGGNGTFDNQDVTTTNYNSVALDNANFSITVSVETPCGDILQESIAFTVNDIPEVNAAGPFTTLDGTQTMTADVGGGTWSADCGACINSTTGVFDPAVSGEGTFQICYDAGCGADCISVLVDDDCTMGKTITSSNPTCFEGDDGDVSINITGAVGTVTYIISGEQVAGTPLNTSTASPTANNLVEGWYYFSVTDDNCTVTDSVFLEDPDDLVIDLIIDEPDCFGIANGLAYVDTVLKHIGDYSQVSFQWSQGSLGSNLVANDSLYNVGANTYFITVTDESTGCQKVEEFVIVYPDSIFFDELGFDYAICRNQIPFDNGQGQVYAAASGGANGYGSGTNFDYLWTQNETGSTTTNSTWGNRNPGSYTILATNDLGCSITETIYLDSLSPIAAFELTSNDFTAPYEGTAVVNIELVNMSTNYAFSEDLNADTTFIWTFGKEGDTTYVTSDINEVIAQQYLTEGEYEICLVVIENLNGCQDTACQKIVVYDQPELEIPNVFTPDGDQINDNFFFPNSAIVEFSCTVFDRWGKQVFTFNNINTVWDGSNENNGKPCTDGVYFYMYEGVSSNGTEYKGQGNVNLIRKQ
jgi:gliding motility-associated-like protein